MAVLTEVVAGWSGALPFDLKADGVVVDLTGLTVKGIVHDRYGVDVDTTGKVTVTGTTSGRVTWTPSTGDLKAAKQPYSVRFKVVDATTAAVYFANGEPDTLSVFAE
jgi:hypothetical protein